MLDAFFPYGNANSPIDPVSDVTMLLSGKPFLFPTLGLAYVGQACQTQRYGIVSDYGTTAANKAFTSIVYAHEVSRSCVLLCGDGSELSLLS